MPKVEIVKADAITHLITGRICTPAGYVLQDVESGFFRTAHGLGRFGRRVKAWTRMASAAKRHQTRRRARTALAIYRKESAAADALRALPPEDE